MRQSWETMTSVSAGHIIQTPTQPVGSGRPQRESNPGPPHQESRALPQSYRAPHTRSGQLTFLMIPKRPVTGSANKPLALAPTWSGESQIQINNAFS